MSGFLLDTNVLSELTRVKPEARVTGWLQNASEDDLYVSVLTLGEIRKGIELMAPGKRREQIQEWLETVLRTWFDGRVISVDQAVAERWGVLTAQAKRAGTPLSVIDGLLAATAAQHNLAVVTRNIRHFDGAGASLFDPWKHPSAE